MFSPSLIAAAFHSLWPFDDALAPHDRPQNIREILHRLYQRRRGMAMGAPGQSLPIVARTRRNTASIQQFLGDDVSFSDEPDAPRGQRFFWGRVPIFDVVSYGTEYGAADPNDEFVDLGTPLVPAASTSLSSDAHQRCDRLLRRTGGSPPQIIVAIVDEGKHVAGATAEDFGGQLTQVITKDIKMSEHAKTVLAVLLERLDGYGLLSDVKVLCSLAAVTSPPIGLQVFEHNGSVELAGAVDALASVLQGENLPVVVNISLGTHVGPHNGNSPAESQVDRLLRGGGKRFVCGAAGNDGARGVHGVRALNAGVRDYMHFNVGSEGCQELLLEFWWDHAQSSSLSMEVDVSVPGVAPRALPSMLIDSNAPASFAVASGSPYARASLFAARCHSNMSCAAFMVTAKNRGDLAGAQAVIELSSNTDVFVNAWTAAGGNAQSSFVGAGSAGTVMVPATADEVISVAGLVNKKVWVQSSYGPSACYELGRERLDPQLSYNADGGGIDGAVGTSFASPRAAADTVKLLLDPALGPQCVSMDFVVQHLVGITSPYLNWNPRIGFGRVVP